MKSVSKYIMMVYIILVFITACRISSTLLNKQLNIPKENDHYDRINEVMSK